MSTFTSSAINKTGRTVAPKAVARRRPADRRQQAPAASNVSTPAPSQTSNEVPAETSTIGAPTDNVVSTSTETREAATETLSTVSNQHVAKERENTSIPDIPTPQAQSATAPLPTPAPTQPPSTATTSDDNDAGPAAIVLESTGDAIKRPVVPIPSREELPEPTTNVPTESEAFGEPQVAATHEASSNASKGLEQQLAGTKRKRGAKSSTTGSRKSARTAAAILPSVEGGEVGEEEQSARAVDGDAGEREPQQKRNSATAGQTTGSEDVAEDTVDVSQAQKSPPPVKPRARRRKKAPLSEATVNEGEAVPQASPAPLTTATQAETSQIEKIKRPQKPRQPRKPRQPKQNNTAEEGISTEAQPNTQGDDRGDDEDPELKQIDPSKTTMTDLIYEKTIGQVSEREKKMQQIDWAEVARKRREGPTVQASEGQDGEGEQPSEQATNQEDTPRRQQPTMQLRMVDGQIVLDEASQHIDRQAQALMDADNMVIDENADLTRRVNSMTWVNDKKRDPADRLTVYKAKSDPWNDDETDRFYEALRMFGTDFHIISKMFAPRTRRQIKLKFVREEKLDPDRINIALSGGQIVPMNLDHYAIATGLEASAFKDPSTVNEELEAQRKLNDEEIEKRREEANEAQKQKDIMHEQREREREDRDREKAVQKERRDEARRRKRAGRGIAGSGTF
ncbi:hypothetical protein K461DRAFT_290231 [Myriangium duriaei CBS 260.36]|uniref:SANT domain-containing protein n=1 Tax=Myriangium duriaei CBS 260.36 TaxID=1168546 RepID=A0A9P4JCA5_9PEZI|nr:hypothetical protein K461DRAFT_290231 [Myriangium duriaei CBS 260.36]